VKKRFNNINCRNRHVDNDDDDVCLFNVLSQRPRVFNNFT